MMAEVSSGPLSTILLWKDSAWSAGQMTEAQAVRRRSSSEARLQFNQLLSQSSVARAADDGIGHETEPLKSSLD